MPDNRRLGLNRIGTMLRRSAKWHRGDVEKNADADEGDDNLFVGAVYCDDWHSARTEKSEMDKTTANKK